MNQSTIAAKLLTLFASGGTFEDIVAGLPIFETQIESAFDWMKVVGRCSATEIAERAAQLRDLFERKSQAMERRDFGLAAKIRAEECAFFESFRLEAPTGDTWHAVLHVGVDEQMRHLSAFLYDTNAA
ncbi:MAG: hypothetical protein HY299_18905 [Verrucomicrobia bacterium]|nr:hypothetical protein [Verrucomicrobiota bacterium]